AGNSGGALGGREEVAVASNGNVVACAAGETRGHAQALADAMVATSFEVHVTARRQHDAARLASAEPTLQQTVANLDRLYQRSLLVFDTLADRATGAVIAAPELDPDRLHSGGYGFVW